MKKLILYLLIIPSFILNAQIKSDFNYLNNNENSNRQKDGIFLSLKDLRNNKISMVVLAGEVNSDKKETNIAEILDKNWEINVLDEKNSQLKIKCHQIFAFRMKDTIYLYKYGKPVLLDENHRYFLFSVNNHYHTPLPQYSEETNNSYLDGQLRNLYPFEGWSDKYICDMETGSTQKLKVKYVKQILCNDNDLFNEFKNLNRKERKRKMLYFIERYNDKHSFDLFAENLNSK
ncbi:MAG: hypothetical protein U0W24_22865 [Bacteroidales bacterium]